MFSLLSMLTLGTNKRYHEIIKRTASTQRKEEGERGRDTKNEMKMREIIRQSQQMQMNYTKKRVNL